MPKIMILSGMLRLIAFCLLASSFTTAQEAHAFAQKVFDITKAGDFTAYQSMFHPDCHPRAFTTKSFDLRSDILKKLAPGAKVEAVPIADFRNEMQKRGAPPDRTVYSVQPTHIVVVRGTVTGLSGGDHVTLNPIVRSRGAWHILDGDCIAAPAPKP